MTEDRINVDSVVLFYADGSEGTEDYTPSYLQSCEVGTRQVHERGGETHIVPRHPWDPTATDADWDAWLKGESRGLAKNCRYQPIPCDTFGIDPKDVAQSHLTQTADGRAAVPGWVADLREVQPSFMEEIQRGIRPNFSAGFRQAKPDRWHGIDLPYCDHFAAFGHTPAHNPPLSQQRHKFESHEVGDGAGRSVHWFSRELYTMSDTTKTLAELAKGLSNEQLREQLTAARKDSNIFQEMMDDLADGDGDGDGDGDKTITVDEVMAAIQMWTAADVAAFASKFAEFQNTLLGAGGETFSAMELEAMSPKLRGALKAAAAEKTKTDSRLGKLEESARVRGADTFSAKLIEGTALKGIPALHGPVRELARAFARKSDRDTFSDASTFEAKLLKELADSVPTLEGGNVPTDAGDRDTFSDDQLGKQYDAQQKKLGWRATEGGRKAHIERHRKAAV